MSSRLPPLQRSASGIGGDSVYLRSALFCERVLNEKDDVLSIIRIVDIFNVSLPRPPGEEDVRIPFPGVLILSFVALGFRGEKVLGISGRNSQGDSLFALAETIRFEGDGDVLSANVIAELGFPISESTVVAFDVSLDGEFVTRIPVIINFSLHEVGKGVPG